MKSPAPLSALAHICHKKDHLALSGKAANPTEGVLAIEDGGRYVSCYLCWS